MVISAIIGFNKVNLLFTSSGTPHTEVPMANTSRESRTNLKTRHNAALYDDFAELSLISVSGACFFVAFIGETSARLNAF